MVKQKDYFQISFTDYNNSITAHISDSKLQDKFLKFLQSENDNDYLVELWETENLDKISQLVFATRISFHDIINTEKNIDLTNFVRLKKIDFYSNNLLFNRTILPDNLFEIEFGSAFIAKLDNLPNGLKILKLNFSHNFNFVLDNLPSGLEELYLSSSYSQPLDFLPNGLKILYFNCNKTYNYNFDNLPNSITKMYVSQYFIDKINNLPSNLEMIDFEIKQLISIKTKQINDICDNIESKIIKIKKNNFINLYFNKEFYRKI